MGFAMNPTTKIPPGPLAPGAAHALTEVLRDVRKMKIANPPKSNGNPVFEKFDAKITAVSAGQYSWTEQWFDATGAYEDKRNGRTGTPTNKPAYERNSRVAVVFPFYAELTRRVVVDSVPVYEFDIGRVPTQFTGAIWDTTWTTAVTKCCGVIYDPALFSLQGKYRARADLNCYMAGTYAGDVPAVPTVAALDITTFPAGSITTGGQCFFPPVASPDYVFGKSLREQLITVKVVAVSCTFTSGSTTATPASMTGLVAGMIVASANVVGGTYSSLAGFTYIVSVGASTIVLSQNASGTGAASTVFSTGIYLNMQATNFTLDGPDNGGSFIAHGPF